MFSQLLTIGILILFAVMLPGPDFALVVKNTLLHSRRSGMFTTLGIGASNLIHMTYCSLGLALVISNSLLLFSFIKYLGAAYLIYLGIQSLLTSPRGQVIPEGNRSLKKSIQSDLISFRQGFLCNLLNPKATLFFLALFTTLIKPDTPYYWLIVFAMEMLGIVILWFFSLTFILSHQRVTALLKSAEKYIAKALGLFLVGFGVALACVGR
ncbi:MAG: Leucine efflux protein [Legionellaceae bacterium]